MRNPIYAEGYITKPMLISITDMVPSMTLGFGIRTITHNRAGLKLHPHKVVVIEMGEGEEIMSFDLTPSYAREVAQKLMQHADEVEIKS